ncbi:DUF1294 domain-containing protein [Bacillus sp. DJP31]|uniref:DUF1294 domain-containing protein n=1 Tax=Bacillus sp. DJP31 TaxID=3409789 RepID=UPI003BB5797D
MISFLFYILITNVVAFFAMYLDKQKAIKNQWRTPEKTLWTLAIIGGSMGMWLGMKSFRHKTKHTSFCVGTPVLIAAQFILVMVILQILS